MNCQGHLLLHIADSVVFSNGIVCLPALMKAESVL